MGFKKEGVMPEEMFFFIADISGYTAYMVRTEMEHAHGIFLINELMKALVKEVALPMEISKLEGDAIFLFLPIRKLPKQMRGRPNLLTEKILGFFTAFSRKLGSMVNARSCDCGACQHLQELSLKIVAHFGKAAMVKIGSFKELSGIDVVLVHRLLKNELQERKYLLMTQEVYQRLSLPSSGRVVQREEKDKDIGTVPVWVYYPREEAFAPSKERNWLEKMKDHALLVLGVLLLKLMPKRNVHYHNLPKAK